MSLYLLTIGRTVYSTRIKTDARSMTKTCIVGMPDRQTAINLSTHLMILSVEDNVHVSEVDYESAKFASMLRLNNLALLITSDYEFDDKIISFSGDLLDVELPIDDDHRKYLELLYQNSATD